MTRRVALYCRVSTDEQASEGASLEQQEAALRREVERLGWTVAAVYRDDKTGTDDNRPGFQQMSVDAEAGKFDVVMVWMWNRLFRNSLMSQMWKERMRKKLQIEVRSVTQPGDPEEPSAFMTERMFEVIDQYHSLEKSQVVKAAKRHQAEMGYHIGRENLGYQRIKGRLVMRQEGAELIRAMATIYETPDATFSLVASQLNKAGHRHLLTGLPFTADRVRAILQNPTYAGYIVHQGHPLRLGLHEPIIEPDRFERLRALAESRQERASVRHSYERQELASLVVCSRCGGMMTAFRHTKSGPARLKCTSRQERRDCDAPGVAIQPLLSAVEQVLDRMQIDPKVIAACEGELATEQVHKHLKDQRAEIQEYLRRADNMYQLGRLTDDEYRRRLEHGTRRLAELGEAQQPAPITAQELRSLLTTYAAAWTVANKGERNALLRTLIAEIRLDRAGCIELVPKPEYVRAFAAAFDSIGPITVDFPRRGHRSARQLVDAVPFRLIGNGEGTSGKALAVG